VKLGALPAGAGDVQKLVVGPRSACITYAVTNGTNVACWGSNYRGLLGANLNSDAYPYQSSPKVVVSVSASSGAITPISATDVVVGRGHACAYSPNSYGITCWGENRSGQLVNGGATPATPPQVQSYSAVGATPQQYPGSGTTLSTYLVKEVAVSDSNTCAIFADSSSSTANKVLRCGGRAPSASDTGTASQVIDAIKTSDTYIPAGSGGVAAGSTNYTYVTQLSYARAGNGSNWLPAGVTPKEGLVGGSNHFSVVGSDGKHYALGFHKANAGTPPTTGGIVYGYGFDPTSYIQANYLGAILTTSAGGGTSWIIATETSSGKRLALSAGDCSVGQCSSDSQGWFTFGPRMSTGTSNALPSAWRVAAGIDRACVVTAQVPPLLYCTGADFGNGSLATLGTTPIGGSAPTNKRWNTVYWN
jgi:hypothetical protein